jgi:hypothetical protein
MSGKMKKSEVAKLPDNQKMQVYAGGEIRTITAKQLKKQMGITPMKKKR